MVGPVQVLLLAASPVQTPRLILLDIATEQITILQESTKLSLDVNCISKPEPIEFPTANGLTAFGLFYPPTNPDYAAPAGELPPLMVMVHGGPTNQAIARMQLRCQYWTSRGFAILDVDYGGSTGYGRLYRERLNGQWGVVDVEDCVNGARYLAEKGLVDSKRLIIRGSSAGGFTVLSALTQHNVFTAGCSAYGVAELEIFAKDTHKFESRYLDRLIGPYPEAREVYIQRSPLTHADKLSSPVIFFQGMDDRIVLPSQSEMMVNALRTKGIPVAYIAFEGEGHGFRRADSNKRAFEAELYFYSRIFGFPLAEVIEPVQIDNLPETSASQSLSPRHSEGEV